MAVWWSFVWRSMVYGFVGGAVFGAITGAIAGATGHVDKAAPYARIVGGIAGLLLSMLAMKQALQKHQARLAASANAVSASPNG